MYINIYIFLSCFIFCYDLHEVFVCESVCANVGEIKGQKVDEEREREYMCVCVWACVCACVSVCMCVCVRMRVNMYLEM